METIHSSELVLAALVFFYGLNLAPMMFESFTSDRIWAANPPDSFHMFRGPYGNKTAHYWRIVSPLAMLTFILSLILNRNAMNRELWLSIAFVFYVAIQASTMAYFVPEQEKVIVNADSLAREVLQSRTRRWIFLNYFRNAAGVLAYVFLMLAVLAPRVQ